MKEIVNKSYNERHKKFQLGTNPMEMTPFEKSRAMEEKREREDARKNYVEGIQGRDGGCLHEIEKEPLS